MIAIPLIVIFLTTLCGILLWSGMEYDIFFIPASLHDLFYLLILVASIDLHEKRRSYHALVCFTIAILFTLQSALQVFDIRPIGTLGNYELFYDNIGNGLLFLSLIVTVYILTIKRYIRDERRLYFFFAVAVTFLACNALLTSKTVRGMFADYAMVYDYMYYTALYVLCLSANNKISEFVRDCAGNINNMLRSWRISIRKSKKA